MTNKPKSNPLLECILSPMSLPLSVFLCLYASFPCLILLCDWLPVYIEVNVWLKLRKHLKIGRTSKIISYLLDMENKWFCLLPNSPPKFLFPNFFVNVFQCPKNVEAAGFLWFCFYLICISAEDFHISTPFM